LQVHKKVHRVHIIKTNTFKEKFELLDNEHCLKTPRLHLQKGHAVLRGIE